MNFGLTCNEFYEQIKNNNSGGGNIIISASTAVVAIGHVATVQ